MHVFFRSVSDEKLEALSASHAMIEFTPSGEILSANDNFLEAMGYGLSEIKGKHHSLFVAEEERRSPAYAAFWKDLAAGRHVTAEFRRLRKDGTEIWIQGTYVPVRDRRGAVRSVVKIATDITERKLRAAEFEGQVTAIGRTQAVIHFDLDGTVLEANDIFLAAVGCRLDEIRGKHHSQFVDPKDRDAAYARFWEDLRRGEARSGEFRRIARNGREIWLQASYTPIRDMNGRPFKVVKYAVDVTALVQERMRRQEIQERIAVELAEIGKAVDGATRQASAAAAASSQTSMNVQAVASGAEQLSASVDEIGRQVMMASEISRRAVDEAARTDERVEGLAASAKRIDEVVRLINDIASQTNLLALNATIEAARAGEAGKGFAVVAGEVKVLAGQTARATEEIAAQISAVQSATTEVVSAIRGIRETILELNGISGGISAGVEEQSAVTRDIALNLGTAAQGVESITASLADIASASDLIDAATAKVRDLSAQAA